MFFFEMMWSSLHRQRYGSIAIMLLFGVLFLLSHFESEELSKTAGERIQTTLKLTNNNLQEVEDDDNDSKWPRRNGKRISEIIAEEKIQAVMNQLGDDGRGPIIVGGIGDSGTRGFWDVLMRFGVYMQGQDNVRGDSRDSLVFMARRRTYQSDGTPLLRSPSALYNEPIFRARSVKYNSSHVRAERWQCGRQYVADLIQQVINDTLTYRGGKNKSGILYPFGFKHPRTALLQPYFLATLGSRFAFIQVIRDGREVASGDNNFLFTDHCRAYYGVRCDDAKAIDMWADLNQEIFEYAMESDMAANQYFAMRVEDLVLGDTGCYENLVKFLQLPPNSGTNITEKIQKAMKSSMSHSRSYFGQKYTYNERLSLVNVQSEKARKALKFWGYKEGQFGISTACTQLPWIEQFRKKKGRLPIDI